MSAKNTKEDKKDTILDNIENTTSSSTKVETTAKKSEDKLTYVVIGNQTLTSFFEVDKQLVALTLNPTETIIVDNCVNNEDIAKKLIQLNFIKQIENA